MKPVLILLLCLGFGSACLCHIAYADTTALGLQLPSLDSLAGGGLLGGGGGFLKKLRGGGSGESPCASGNCHSDECLGLHRVTDTQQVVQQQAPAPAPAKEEANHGMVMAACFGAVVLVGALVFGAREKQFLT